MNEGKEETYNSSTDAKNKTSGDGENQRQNVEHDHQFDLLKSTGIAGKEMHMKQWAKYGKEKGARKQADRKSC